MKINKKFVLTSIAAGSILTLGTIAATTVSYAATKDSANSNPIISRVAQILGIDKTKLTDAMKQASAEKVDDMLKNGKITQDQATKLKSDIQNGKVGKFGIDMKRDRGGMMNYIDDTASFLGISSDDLKTSLKDGKKLSDIITSKGKTISDLKTYLIQKETDRLNQNVKDGKITQDQANKKISMLSSIFDNFINGTMSKPSNKNVQ